MAEDNKKEVEEKTHEATLVNGGTYFLGNIRFDKGKPKKVTASEAAELKGATLVRTVMMPDETYQNEPLNQFEIKELKAEKAASKKEAPKEEETDEETPAPRTRTREVAKK